MCDCTAQYFHHGAVLECIMSEVHGARGDRITAGAGRELAVGHQQQGCRRCLLRMLQFMLAQLNASQAAPLLNCNGAGVGRMMVHKKASASGGKGEDEKGRRVGGCSAGLVTAAPGLQLLPSHGASRLHMFTVG